MRYSMGHCFLSFSCGDGATHDDGLHLPPWVCDPGISRHADCLARSSSPYLLLAGVYASCALGATHLGRDGSMDTSDYHRVALWSFAQSRLLERASVRPLVGAGSHGHFVFSYPWGVVSGWRWQSRR